MAACHSCPAWMQSIGSLLCVVLELGVFALIVYSAVELFQLRIDWEQRIVLAKTSEMT